jgi:hypothetical protein
MRFRWRELLVMVAALAKTERGAAQQVWEIGIQAIGTSSRPALGVIGGYGALRTSGRTRVSVGLGGGISDGDLAGRGELLAHFLLSPEQRHRAGFYVAGGVAAVAGPVSRGYLVLSLGLEDRPRRRSGWAVEAGLGGGVRVSVGYRWRHFPAFQE